MEISQSLIKFSPDLDSRELLLVIVFTKTNSVSYPLVVNIAKGALGYKEVIINSKLYHMVAFNKNCEGAQRAILLLNRIAQWKGLEIYAQNRPLRYAHEIIGVLQCYIKALACTDYKAHCISIMEDPMQEKPRASEGGLWVSLGVDLNKSKASKPIIKTVEQYSFPCSKLLHNHLFKFQISHPSSPANQIQASAVQRNIDLCPFFDPSSFKRLGTRIVNLK